MRTMSMSERELELIGAIHQLHAIIVGTLENELSLDVPTSGTVDSVKESMILMDNLGLQQKFDDEMDLIEQAEEFF